MQPIGNWSYPNAFRFGTGRLAELPDVVAEIGLPIPYS